MTITRAGSAARRAIDHLSTLPPGSALTGAELAAAIGIEASDTKALVGSAIRSGEILVDMSTPRKHLYSVPAAGAQRRAASVVDLAGTAGAEEAQESAPAAQRKAKVKRRPIAAAMPAAAAVEWKAPPANRVVRPTPTAVPGAEPVADPALDCALMICMHSKTPPAG